MIAPTQPASLSLPVLYCGLYRQELSVNRDFCSAKVIGKAHRVVDVAWHSIRRSKISFAIANKNIVDHGIVKKLGVGIMFNTRDLIGHLRTDCREFLVGSAAATIFSGLPGPARATETYGRKSLQGTNVAADLQRYAKAAKAMLSLPPEDPRNWYRIALTHVLDCPHGNWWFLVWHRGYLGYFEQICREVAGEPDFALIRGLDGEDLQVEVRVHPRNDPAGRPRNCNELLGIDLVPLGINR